MGIVIFGEKKSSIHVDEFFVRCPVCEKQAWADVMVASTYFHLYYIPFFPTGKEANVICHDCGVKRYGLDFNARLISNYEEIKYRYRHKWYTYTGVLLFGAFVIAIVIGSL